MLGLILGLTSLALLTIYIAVILGKKTDERIARYMAEDGNDSPLLVRFPEDVFRVKTSLTHG